MIFVLLVFCTASMAQSDDAQRFTTEWQPALQPALLAWRRGETDEALRLARLAAAADPADPAIRNEARAIEAMAALRAPARDARRDGRVLSSALELAYPAALERPEFQLAYGQAATADSETMLAIDVLEEAYENFRARGDDSRAIEALAALARAWGRHGEWEITPIDFVRERPATTEQADQLRLGWIEQTLERARALTVAPTGADPVRLELARFHLAGERKVLAEEHLALLVGRDEWSTTHETAAALLSELMVDCGRLKAAVAIDRRLAQCSSATGRAAQGRLAQLLRPSVSVVVAPDGLKVRTRNVHELEIELRKLDLVAWLTERQGRLIESQLPESGSVLFRQRLTPAAPDPQQPNETHVSDVALTESSGQAAVLIARWKLPSGKTQRQKQLLTLSDTRGTALLGRTRALVWLDRLANGRGYFWMRGSFVPTRFDVREGQARFDLPPERRVLVDHHWVCVVDTDAGQVVLQGESVPPSDDGPQRALVVATPPMPVRGAPVDVTGLLLDARGTPWSTDEPVDVEVTFSDAADKHRRTVRTTASAVGLFSASLQLDETLDAQPLRVNVAAAGRVLETLPRQVRVHPDDRTGEPLLIGLRAPTRLSLGQEEVPLTIMGWYPWGTPVADRMADVTARTFIPATTQTPRVRYYRGLSEHGHTDQRGVSTLEAHLRPHTQPLAVGLWSTVTGWAGSSAVDFRAYLTNGAEHTAWLLVEPGSPRVGEGARFQVGWFDTRQRILADPPTVRIFRGDKPVATLTARQGVNGYATEYWRPTEPGHYRATAEIPSLTGASLFTERAFEVAGDGSPRPLAPIERTAHWHSNEKTLQLTIDDTNRERIVCVLHDDPFQLQRLPARRGSADQRIPDIPETPASVLLFENGAPAEILPVEQHESVSVGALQIAAPAERVAPGAAVAVTIRSTDPRLTHVLLRLVDANDQGFHTWLTPIDAEARRRPGASFVWADHRGNSATLTTDVVLPAPLADAVTGPAPWWTASAPFEAGVARTVVPLPVHPSVYRLHAVAVGPGGIMATGNALIDANTGLEVMVDAPAMMHVGDRVQLSISLRNPTRDPIDFAIAFPDQAALDLGAPTALLDRGRVNRSLRKKETIAAGEIVSLIVPVEAIARGVATFDVRMTVSGVEQQVAQPIVVADPLPPAVAPSISVERSYYRARRTDRERARPTGGVYVSEHWEVDTQPVTEFASGETIFVRETVHFRRPVDAIAWVQTMPANTFALAVPKSLKREAIAIGILERRERDRLRYRLGRIAPGRYQHSYLMVATRPGSAQMPQPTVTVGTEVVPVATFESTPLIVR